jgi:hypothetical protein
MGWWVSPVSGVVGIGLMRHVGGPTVASECRGHVSRCPVAFDACCCTKTFASCRGHVSGLVFMREMSCALGVRVGVERGAPRCVVGARGSVASRWGCIVDTGGHVDGDGGWLVLGCRRGCV